MPLFSLPQPTWLALKIPPAALWLLCSSATVTTPNWLDWPWPSDTAWLLGCVAMVAGAAVCLSGVLAFRRLRTTVNPLNPAATSTLAVRGIYRYSRNPMYLGFALGLLGVSALAQQPLGVVWTAAFVLYLQRYQIRPEEAALHAQFGPAYVRYCQQVRRWI